MIGEERKESKNEKEMEKNKVKGWWEIQMEGSTKRWTGGDLNRVLKEKSKESNLEPWIELSIKPNFQQHPSQTQISIDTQTYAHPTLHCYGNGTPLAVL